MWHHHLQEVSLFVTKVYLTYWFPAALRHDLALLCALSEYPNIEIAKAATTAFERHLWYLSEILIAFAFFDDAVTTEEKHLMVVTLQEVIGLDEPLKRIQPFRNPTTKKLHNFVTKTQLIFFTIHGISQDFIPGLPAGRSHPVEMSSRVSTKPTVCSVCQSYQWPGRTWGCIDSRVQLKFDTQWRTEAVSALSHRGPETNY